MLCQNCRENEANVRYTQVVNGVKKQMILCEECAEKMGINNFKINMPIHFSNLLDNFFDDAPLLPSFMKEKSRQRSSYNDLYDDFIKTELLKCAESYNMFDDRLNSELKNTQDNEKNSGKKTLDIFKKMQNIGENTTKKVRKTNKTYEANELEQLKKDLDKAIKEERYEDAAIIRDKIKKINDQ